MKRYFPTMEHLMNLILIEISLGNKFQKCALIQLVNKDIVCATADNTTTLPDPRHHLKIVLDQHKSLQPPGEPLLGQCRGLREEARGKEVVFQGVLVAGR